MSKHLSLAGEEAQWLHAARDYQSALRQFSLMRLHCPSETSPKKLAARICINSSCTSPSFLCTDNKCECAASHRKHLEGGVVFVTDLIGKICHKPQLSLIFEKWDLESLLSSATDLQYSPLTGDSLQEFLLPPSNDQLQPTTLEATSLNNLKLLIPVLNTVALCQEEIRSVWAHQQPILYLQGRKQLGVPADEWTQHVVLYSPQDRSEGIDAIAVLTGGMFIHQDRIKQITINDSMNRIPHKAFFFIRETFPLLNKLTLRGDRLVQQFQGWPAWPAWLTTLCLYGSSNWDAPQVNKLRVYFSEFTDLCTLELTNFKLLQSHLIAISKLHFLVDLTFSNNLIHSEQFKHIFKLKLRRLRLDRQRQVTDEVVNWLSNAPALRNLEILEITGCSITRGSVHNLKSLKCLTELKVGRFQEEILSIAQHLPSLARLSINKYPYHTGDVLMDIDYKHLPVGCLQVISTFSQLRQLRILGFDLTSRDSCYMNRLTNLTTLAYTTIHAQVSSEWLGQLRNLEDLQYCNPAYYSACWELDLSFARQIPLLTKLRKVDLSRKYTPNTTLKTDQTTLLECVRAISTLPLLSDISISKIQYDLAHEFYSGEALWLLSRVHGLKKMEVTVPHWTDLTELRRLNRAEQYKVELGIKTEIEADVHVDFDQRRRMREIEFDFLKKQLQASKNPGALKLN